MFDLTDLIFVQKNILSDDECQTIIDAFNKKHDYFNEHSTNAFTLENKQSGGLLCSLQPHTDEFFIAHTKTSQMIRLYDEHLKQFDFIFSEALLNSFRYSHNYRLIKYRKDNFIHDHIDWSPQQTINGSCTLNLNDDYEGGEFTFFGNKYDIKLGKGDGLIFPASIFYVHGTKKVTNGIRYCVNSFLQMTSDRDDKNYFEHQYTKKYKDLNTYNNE